MDKEVKRMIRESKRKYVAAAVEKGRKSGSNAAYFRVSKELNTKDRLNPWTVQDMYTELSVEDVASTVTEYFGSISDILPPLDISRKPLDCPTNLIEPLQLQEVAVLLKKAKKPSSMVTGDVFPYLFNSFDFSCAVTPVFNCILRTKQWPEDWKIESVTVIPKCSNPTSFDQLRNISCTLQISKIYKSYLLMWAREEVLLRRNQYGGKGGVQQSTTCLKPGR